MFEFEKQLSSRVKEGMVAIFILTTCNGEPALKGLGFFLDQCRMNE